MLVDVNMWTLITRLLFSTLEISLPNEQARMEILKIHAAPIAKHGEIGKGKALSFFVRYFVSCL